MLVRLPNSSLQRVRVLTINHITYKVGDYYDHALITDCNKINFN